MAGPLRHSDEELMLAFQKGDANAFGELLSRHQGPVMRFLYRFTGNRDLAEDLFQEVFLRVVKSAKSFRAEAKFTTWLYRIARNLCIDKVRRNGLVTMVSTEEVAVGSHEDGQTIGERLRAEGPDPETAAGRQALAGKLSKAVDELPEEQREVFVMRELLDMPYNEIADVTGTPENTVKSRMRYALEGLRRKLRALGPITAEEAR